MKTICSICLEEISDSLLAFTNCGHVFDRSCVAIWLRTSQNCPICRKNVHETHPYGTQSFYRIYLTTENDDSSNKEKNKLKEKLETARNRAKELQSKVEYVVNRFNVAQREYENTLKIAKQNKSKLETTIKDLEGMKISNSKLIQQANENQLVKKRLAENLEISEANCETLKEHIGAQGIILFYQLLKLKDKSNCSSCKKENAKVEEKEEEGVSKPADLEKLSKTQLKKRYHDLQEKFDFLQSLHYSMSIANAGPNQSSKTKLYIENLEKQLKESKARERKLEALSKRNNGQEHLAKELTTAKTKQTKLESDIKELIQGRLCAIEDQKAIKTALQKAKKNIDTLEKEKQESHKKNCDLQQELTAAKQEAAKLQEFKQNWVEENRSLNKQLKSSRKYVKKLQSAKAKITEEKKELQQTLDRYTTTYPPPHVMATYWTSHE